MTGTNALRVALNIFVIASISTYLWAEYGDRRSNANQLITIDIPDGTRDQILEGAFLLGNDTTILAIEFVDYQCEFCELANRAIEHVIARRDEGAIAVIHIPPPMHDTAEGAARAAICAAEQGLFSEMHQLLFDSTDWHANPSWVELAVSVGLNDTTEFKKCLRSERTSARLEKNRMVAGDLGVRATPTFIIQSAMYVGSLDRRLLRTLIDAQAEAINSTPPR